MQQLSDLSIATYLTELASSAATPGGGCAAGLTATQAAALLAMVCNLSGGEKLATVSRQISAIRAACGSIQELLLDLTAQDTRAFSDLMASYKLPRNSQEETDERAERIQHALKNAAWVPLEVMRETGKLAPHATLLGEIGNPNLITDVGVAVHLMEAALNSARLNVLVNARLVNESDYMESCRTEAIGILKQFTVQKTRCLAAVEERLHG